MDVPELIEKNRIKRWLGVRKRAVVEEGIYYITQRATGREILFNQDKDYQKFLALTAEVSKKWRLEPFCFCLLPDQLHLLLKIHQKTLSLAMKSLFERYANYFNRRYQRHGHVFSGRYRSLYCNDQRYCLAVSLYLHLSPYWSRLCSQPDNYPYSSVGAYLKGGKGTLWNPDPLLDLCSEDKARRRQQYAALFHAAARFKVSGHLTSSQEIGGFILHCITKTLFPQPAAAESGLPAAPLMARKPIRAFQGKKERNSLIQQLKASGLKYHEIAEALSLSRWTIYRILNKYNIYKSGLETLQSTVKKE